MIQFLVMFQLALRMTPIMMILVKILTGNLKNKILNPVIKGQSKMIRQLLPPPIINRTEDEAISLNTPDAPQKKEHDLVRHYHNNCLKIYSN